jgi:hypothetical protein
VSPGEHEPIRVYHGPTWCDCAHAGTPYHEPKPDAHVPVDTSKYNDRYPPDPETLGKQQRFRADADEFRRRHDEGRPATDG